LREKPSHGGSAPGGSARWGRHPGNDVPRISSRSLNEALCRRARGSACGVPSNRRTGKASAATARPAFSLGVIGPAEAGPTQRSTRRGRLQAIPSHQGCALLCWRDVRTGWMTGSFFFFFFWFTSPSGGSAGADRARDGREAEVRGEGARPPSDGLPHCANRLVPRA